MESPLIYAQLELSWNLWCSDGQPVLICHALFIVRLFVPFLLFAFSGEERGVMQGEMHQTALESSLSLATRKHTFLS